MSGICAPGKVLAADQRPHGLTSGGGDGRGDEEEMLLAVEFWDAKWYGGWV